MTAPGRCRACGRPPAPGKTRCPARLAAARDRLRERTAAGVCRRCDAATAPGRSLCPAHLAARRASAAARRGRQAAEGRCVELGCPDPPAPGSPYCPRHRAYHAAYTRDHPRRPDGRRT